jgi:hypothetical protein
LQHNYKLAQQALPSKMDGKKPLHENVTILKEGLRKSQLAYEASEKNNRAQTKTLQGIIRLLGSDANTSNAQTKIAALNLQNKTLIDQAPKKHQINHVTTPRFAERKCAPDTSITEM